MLFPKTVHGGTIAALLLAGALAGCVRIPVRTDPLRECRALYATVDAKVRRSGATDPGLYRVPGFPYLRSSRFLASFRDEVDDAGRFQSWLALLRKADSEARDREILVADGQRQWTAPLSDLRRRLQDCGDRMAQADLATPAARARLREAVRVPSDYSLVQRVFGAYPLALPFLRWGVSDYQAQVRKSFEQPLQAPPSGQLRLWRLAADPKVPKVSPHEMAAWIARGRRQPLAIPAFSPRQLQRMFATYAPAWWVATAGNDDLPGRVLFNNDNQPVLDSASPVSYALQDYTRVDGKILPQLVYIVWFNARPAHSALDPYAGHLDGVIWRVTLGSDGRPLVYDTIHPCGCYHEYFPGRALKPRDDAALWREAALIPQRGPVGVAPVAVRIAAGTHYVQRVVPLADVPSSATGRYALLPYENLLELPDAEGRPRSLFDPDTGLVAGTERTERWWLWVSGVRSPGAMRAWGRHAIKFVGEEQFDDPYLLEHAFDFGGSRP
ncbi:MAG TPA: hypothetical protein VN046_03980 [Stenotrophobium sp.]|nr:hypothetical protein [Stenotrophobium sp.]